MLEIYSEFPFLPTIKEDFYFISDLKPISFISYCFSNFGEEITTRTKKLFDTALDNKEELPSFRFDLLHIIFYIFIKMMLYSLDNIRISNKVANLYSKIIYKKLMNKDNYGLFQVTQYLDLDIKYQTFEEKFGRIYIKDDQYFEKKTHFLLNYIDYLHLSRKIKDNKRKLIHQALDQGYIYLRKRDLVRLLQELVRSKVLSSTKSESKEELENFNKDLFEYKSYKEIYDYILKKWESVKTTYTKIDLNINGKILESHFPPCINQILSKTKEGVNLNHQERLVLVFFLNSINAPYEKVLSIFSQLPDFDPNKAGYQISHSRKKGYLSYNCANIKTFGLCYAEVFKDDLCLKGYFSITDNKEKKISNPLSYVKIKQIRKKKEQNKANP